MVYRQYGIQTIRYIDNTVYRQYGIIDNMVYRQYGIIDTMV